jgi:hypothetical protein
MAKNKFKEISDKLTQLQKDNRLTKDEVMYASRKIKEVLRR